MSMFRAHFRDIHHFLRVDELRVDDAARELATGVMIQSAK